MALSYNSKFTKFVAVFLAVLLFVFCFSVPRAHAVVAEAAAAAVVVAGASYVIASILIAMGVRPGSDSTDFNALRDAVVLNLQGLGMVTADGKITLYGFGSGLTMVGASVISAIRNFLLNGSGDIPAVIYPSGFYNPVVNGSGTYNGGYGTVTWSSTVPVAVIVSYFGSYLRFSAITTVPYDSSVSQSISYNVVRNSDNYVYASGSLALSTAFYGNYRSVAFCNLYRSSSLENSSVLPYFAPAESYNDTSDFIATLPISSVSLTTDQDIDIADATDLNVSDVPDVIWPGWAEKSDYVDTNISTDLDNDGAIDNIVPYDRYYPISIPWDLTDVLTWTQEKAQEGSLVDTADLTTSPGSSTNDWLPVLGNGFSFPSIWHYVTEWLSYISSFISKISSVWSVLPWGMVVPVYACIVLIITFGIYRKFIK